jgi:uncharacterized protein (DUF2062 family)
MGLGGMMAKVQVAAKRNAIFWLRQGISPRRLALTLALGFAVGCIPLVGLPTVLCAVLALTLRLNLPAIQTANYVAMPLQLALIVPFVRLGRWLVPPHGGPAPIGLAFDPRALLHLPALNLATHLATSIGDLAAKALLAWLLVAIPAVALMTFALTHMLRRIPALRASEAGD